MAAPHRISFARRWWPALLLSLGLHLLAGGLAVFAGRSGAVRGTDGCLIVDTVVRHPGTEAPVDLVLDDPPPLPVFQVRILEPAPVPAGTATVSRQPLAAPSAAPTPPA